MNFLFTTTAWLLTLLKSTFKKQLHVEHLNYIVVYSFSLVVLKLY